MHDENTDGLPGATGPADAPGPTDIAAVPGPDATAGPDGPSVGDDLPGPAAPPPTPRSFVLSIGALASAVLLVALVLLPVPYAVSSPGPTRDTLGSHDGEALIDIKGATTYPSTGRLLLTTVSATGGPGFPSGLGGVVRGWLSPSSIVLPAEQVFPTNVTQDQLDQTNQAAMVSSQENASVAALEELGYQVPVTLTVAGTVPGTGAEGVLEKDDVLTTLDGTALSSYGLLIDLLADMDGGATVTLGITRGGEAMDVPVVTGDRDGGGAQLGVYIDPTFDMPVDVTIRIDDIGGPSAGTMFALGIIDLLTPEDEAGGQVIAGTGTMDLAGQVGPIGGIRQKLAGARRDGARWFLAPESNCDEVVGHVPGGLRVVKISTLHDAREAVAAIGAGKTDDLPTCTAG